MRAKHFGTTKPNQATKVTPPWKGCKAVHFFPRYLLFRSSRPPALGRNSLFIPTHVGSRRFYIPLIFVAGEMREAHDTELKTLCTL